jgi:hypothetical protein
VKAAGSICRLPGWTRERGYTKRRQRLRAIRLTEVELTVNSITSSTPGVGASTVHVARSFLTIAASLTAAKTDCAPYRWQRHQKRTREACSISDAVPVAAFTRWAFGLSVPTIMTRPLNDLIPVTPLRTALSFFSQRRVQCAPSNDLVFCFGPDRCPPGVTAAQHYFCTEAPLCAPAASPSCILILGITPSVPSVNGVFRQLGYGRLRTPLGRDMSSLFFLCFLWLFIWCGPRLQTNV